jgi:AcrR family transcriptional regulator
LSTLVTIPRSRPGSPDPNARGTRKTLVEGQIVEAATELFAQRGFAGTSLQDIADATGLTRPALYHYFSSKEDLLSRLVSAATEGPADELRGIRLQEGVPGVERLHAMASSIALLQARYPARFRLLIRSEADLPAALAKTYDSGRRRVLREVTALIEEGVRGHRRDPGPGVAQAGRRGPGTPAPGRGRVGRQADPEQARSPLTY